MARCNASLIKAGIIGRGASPFAIRASYKIRVYVYDLWMYDRIRSFKKDTRTTAPARQNDKEMSL